MANIPEYLKILFPQPYLVFGIKLKNFSLGHYLLLKSVDSPFLDESKQRVVEYNDLLFAFAICSRNWDDAYELANDFNKSMEFYKDMEEELLKQVNSLNLSESVNVMQEYINNGFKVPLYEADESVDTKDSGTYWMQSILLTLTSELNYTRQEALNCPMSQAVHDYFWYIEKNGSLTILPEWKVEQIKQAEELAKKI